MIKKLLSDLVVRVGSGSPNIIWCKLKKQLLGIEPDIYLGAVYIPPLQSQRKAGEDVFGGLES